MYYLQWLASQRRPGARGQLGPATGLDASGKGPNSFETKDGPARKAGLGQSVTNGSSQFPVLSSQFRLKGVTENRELGTALCQHRTQRGTQSAHHLRELAKIERLRTVGKCALWTGMHLDDEAVRSDRNRRPRNRPDQALLAGPMRGIGHYGQVREFFGEGDGGKVKGVSHAGFERLDSALTKDDLVVSSGQQVFRRQQPFLHRGRGSSLEQDGFLDDGEPAQQGEVLHIACADLEHIGVLADQVHIFGTHDLGYDWKAGEFASFAQNLQSFDPQALKLIRRGARFIGSAAQHGGARALHSVRSFEQLFARFHGAGTGNDDHLRAADSYAASLSFASLSCASLSSLSPVPANDDHRRLRPGLTADEFEGLGDGDHVVYSGSDR